MNEKFHAALNGTGRGAPPVWFMRQAGRYHQHYQNLRRQHSFDELCRTPELAAQVALGPIQDFDFDVSILFSDLLYPLDAIGLGLSYSDAGPRLERRWTPSLHRELTPWERAVTHMEFQREAVRQTRKVLPGDKSLIGFIGGPWTLFGYAVEGSHAGGLKETKRHLRDFATFCEQMVPLLCRNIELQLEGGAEVVMVFDTAAGELAPDVYAEVVYPQLQKMSHTFLRKLGYYAKGVTMDHLKPTVMTGRDGWLGLGVDHRFDLPALLEGPGDFFVQGNFDQTFLFQDPDVFESTARAYLQRFKSLSPRARGRWVCGLGHGVLPQTPERNVARFVELVRSELGER